MNQKMYKLIISVTVLALFLSGCVNSIGGSKIKDITTDPGKYKGTEVTISGNVIEVNPEIKMNNEILVLYKINDGSASIYIRGNKSPKLNEQVTVTGTVETRPDTPVIIDATTNK